MSLVKNDTKADAASLLMLAYYFPPRGGSGVQRSLKFTKYLPEYGVRPVVLTVDEREIINTGDKSLLDDISGAPVYRSPSGERLIKQLGRMRLGPLVSLLLRPDAHILWRRGAVKKAREAIKKHQCEAIYVSVQPWSAAMIGLELKKKLGLPLIVDFRDPWSYSTSLHWPSKWHYLRDCKMEESVFRQADAIISVTPGMVGRYKERYPFAADKIHLIHNGYDSADFGSESKTACPARREDKLRIGFAGRLYDPDKSKSRSFFSKLKYRLCEIDFTTHSLGCFVPALVGLFGRKPGLRDKFEFHLAGNIPESNRKLVSEAGLSDCIHFHGMLPHKEAVSLISNSDVAWLPMMTELNGQRSFNESGKIFEYLYNGTPILATVPEGDAAELTRKANAGWVVNPMDAGALGNKIEELILLKSEGKLGLDRDKDFIRTFERRHQAGELAGIIANVI